MNDQSPRTMVRIKYVNLNHCGPSARTATPRHLGDEVSALVGPLLDRNVQSQPVQFRRHGKDEVPAGEVCLATGRGIEQGEFENHIETCVTCSNRVELQLDFIETLEVAIYQQRANADAKRVGGALLVSSPELNFAICGELEI